MRILQITIAALIFTALFLLFPAVAEARRVRDLARVDGIRPIHLTGIGLVIGLNGTGDSQRNGVLKQYYLQVGQRHGALEEFTGTDIIHVLKQLHTAGSIKGKLVER